MNPRSASAREFRCTAIVPTLDRPAELEACLRSLRAAEPRFDAVIVVDQSFSAALRSLVEGLGARYLHLDRRGLSLARNKALAMVDTPWCYFPDDDCTVAPDLLAQVGSAVEAHPEVAFAAAHVATPEGRAVMVGMDGRGRLLVTPEDALATVMSPGLFVTSNALRACGGFDELFGVGARWPSGEESDLLFRLLEDGQVGLYLPQAVVTHPDPFAVRDERAQIRRALLYGRGWGALFAKHAKGPSGHRYARLQRRFEVRALGGALVSLLRFQPGLAMRRWYSWRGRREGWLGWHACQRSGE